MDQSLELLRMIGDLRFSFKRDLTFSTIIAAKTFAGLLDKANFFKRSVMSNGYDNKVFLLKTIRFTNEITLGKKFAQNFENLYISHNLEFVVKVSVKNPFQNLQRHRRKRLSCIK